jgi:hypothetical protein
MTIQYRPGRIHHNADALSRAPLPEVNSISTASIDPSFLERVRTGYKTDKGLSEIMSLMTHDQEHPPHLKRFQLTKEGLLLFQGTRDNTLRLCIPDHDNLRLSIMNDHHDAPSAGHLGMPKTYNSIARQYFWNNMSRDIRNYVRSCVSCQRNKVDQSGPSGLLQPLPVPPQRWHTVSMDFAGPFIASGEANWDMVLVVLDKLSKRAHLIPTKSTDKAPDTAKRFFETIVKLHGLPKVIISDRDAKFTSMFWTSLMQRFGTKIAMSTAYHPQTDGQSERMVRTMKEMLRHYISQNQKDWTDHLPTIELAYNNSLAHLQG